MITIVDYGLGNVQAFATLFRRLHVSVQIAKEGAELELASKIVLPGVGAFDHAVDLLNASGMRDRLNELVLEQGIPILGVCVGMQILMESSEEGSQPGLGWVRGQVRRFQQSAMRPPARLPHMGWNDVAPVPGAKLFKGIENGRFYFLHSYYTECAVSADILATSEYAIPFTSAFACGNIFGVQFHPEKSHDFGTKLLMNFAEL